MINSEFDTARQINNEARRGERQSIIEKINIDKRVIVRQTRGYADNGLEH